MNDLRSQRRFYAEEIEATENLASPALVEALATVERERFLRPGPWLVRGEGDFLGPPRHTPDAHPRRVFHNVSIAIDPVRQLFNAGPGIVAREIDALALEPGHRVLHIGCGLGYYSAVMAHIVGPAGRVISVEVDEVLAQEAARNLAAFPWVEVRRGNGTEPLEESLNAIVLSAGVTHPRDAWLDALVTGGRLVLPLTATMPQMGTLGKGPIVLATKISEQRFDVRNLVPVVACYSAIGLRDESLNQALGKALMRGPFVAPKRLRRDLHAAGPQCWLHASTLCFTVD
jgi:protein-L-isoaspartate(D-aspartate) O-methyltransferase